MHLQIGDKVSFLNEQGGGVVLRFLNSSTAVVETPDGFEIPYAVKELVPVNYASSKTARIVSEKPDAPAINTGAKGVAMAEGIYLCFVPKNIDDISETRFTVYLYNNSRQHDILFNLFGKNNNGHAIISSDRLLAGNSLAIDNIPAGGLDKYTGGILQVLFYSGTMAEIKEPETIPFKVKVVKLVDKNSYNHLVHFNAHGVAVALYPKRNESQSAADYDLNSLSQRFSKDTDQNKPAKSKPQVFEMEVDLHIEELLDDMRGLTNGEMLNLQLEHARKKLDEAVTRNCRKLILIHGVGNGRLKTEIRQMLDGYAGLEYYDASYARYGIGATEVKLVNVRLK